MMRRAMMYLRPGNLYKEFVIEDNKADIGKTGRATASFSGDGSRMLKGALAEATPKQKVEWQQLQHPISHTINVINFHRKTPFPDSFIAIIK